ncbi:hypothetical protein L6218_14980 [Pseudomonas syringae pv. syringae]|uniref:hypothetical protein n=1 Tax=Pseudomonas TaxID=286 RepID=UPI001F10EBE4|nr:hypothetical protein [Pseudomonas syringae]MCH5499524.1 hypothetical protein [Pseudomonas syringae pv. syringae]MCH5525669.1 hypothetical protein [Pseudomonas syringae pv. syringae]MCH5560765.1 hypothetical protein [Pseudomonas syringae pv. syringae]MCH5566015.1 hypothetical protein [Pseudomonas syringae pv. syringae]MCH5581289.1 hypothetical protein [Pseudomonas syringae pv. syringae]
MEFFGFMFLAGFVLWGFLLLSNSGNAIAEELRRSNDLKEAELRSRGVTVNETDVVEASATNNPGS